MGNLAYFNDLKYLRKKDKIYLKFENKTLEYEVVNIRSNIKNGKIMNTKGTRGGMIAGYNTNRMHQPAAQYPVFFSYYLFILTY